MYVLHLEVKALILGLTGSADSHTFLPQEDIGKKWKKLKTAGHPASLVTSIS
jgi:hypothetical protein